MGGEKGTTELSNRFGRISLGFLLVKNDGTLIDRYYTNFGVTGQLPNPEQIIAALDRSLKGIDTLPVLTASVEKNPQDAKAAFKLARKYEEIVDSAKATDLFRKVATLDPGGKAGIAELPEGKVTYKEYADYKVAQTSLHSTAPAVAGQPRQPDYSAYRAFMSKYPQSVLVKQIYRTMASYYAYSATKDEAANFFTEVLAKYPTDNLFVSYYVTRIVSRDKDPADADKGIALMDKLRAAKGLDAGDSQTLASLYLLKGDQEKAEEVFGKEWLKSTKNQSAQGLLGYVRFWLGNKKNLEGGEGVVDQAMLLGPGTWQFRQQVADLYVKLDKSDKALKVYGPELTRTTSGTLDEYFAYVNFWAKQGKNVDGALAVAKQIEASPLSAVQWSSLAQAYLGLKRYNDAQRTILKAIDKEPNERMKTRYASLQKQIEDAMNQGAAGK